MKDHRSKHSKRKYFAPKVVLITMGLLFLIVMGCAKEVGKQRGDMINNQTTPTSGTQQPVNMGNKIIIDINKEGEIWIENDKVDLDSIKRRIEDFMNEYPDGNVIITCDKGPFDKTVVEVLDQLRLAKVKNVVVAAEKK